MKSVSFIRSSVILAGLAAAPTALAQPLEPPIEVEDSKHQFIGVVNASGVFVRSGPSENDYPTMRLDQGAEVTVTGIRFTWLKIQPPTGSFCYVAKAWVQKMPDGQTGRVTDVLNVRVGSSLNAMKTRLATKLQPGATVSILGEDDEYYRIAPPAGVFMYVNKQFVDPVRPLGAAPAAAPAATVVAGAPEAAPPAVEPAAPPTPAETAAAAEPAPPVNLPALVEPVVSEEEKTFASLEEQLRLLEGKPIDQQADAAALRDQYRALSTAAGLAPSRRQIAGMRADALQLRADAYDAMIKLQQTQEQRRERQVALVAERDEIQQRIASGRVDFYVAVGTLRPSSLQIGATPLYRLTDPASGRTVVYLRSDEVGIGSLMGQFVAVNGDLHDDPGLNLRVIRTTQVVQANPAMVNRTIAAQIVPPSLIPAGSTASTGSN